jgi:MoxR-like ATPase
MKGSGRAWVVPATVTWRSAIASRSADCTLGGARLTSSTRTREWNRGPARNSKCTPDLMPADLTGTTVWRPDGGRFEFLAGPLFHSLRPRSRGGRR